MAFWDRWKRSKPAAVSVVALVREGLAQVAGDRAWRAFEQAWTDAEAGRGAEAAAALGPLGDRERLLASAVLGASHAAVAVAMAKGVEAAFGDRKVEWNGRAWCDVLGAWLVASVDEVGVARCSRLLAGGYNRAKGDVLVVLVRDRLAR